MDVDRFDRWTKTLATGTSRRRLLRRVGGSVAGVALAGVGLRQAGAAPEGNRACAVFCATVFGATEAAGRCTSQATRRVLAGETVPAHEKLLSLFEPHTQIIKRHKAGLDVEFGRKIWLAEVDGGIVSGYRLLQEAGQDEAYLAESLAAHQRQFGRAPWLVTGDRGVSSPANEQLAQLVGVTRVVLPANGRASPQRQQQERQAWVRRGYRFRAGIEGRISVLRRCFGLARCRNHGEEGLGRWIGWGMVTANLAKIAATISERSARRVARVA